MKTLAVAAAVLCITLVGALVGFAGAGQNKKCPPNNPHCPPATTTTPTTSPTTAPTTTAPPPAGTNCFASPGKCGFPDPTTGNVGVPPGTNLTPSGPITASTPGAVINGLDVTGSISVNANNVTIRNTRITGNSGGLNSRLVSTCTGCNTTFENVELTSQPGANYEFAIHGAGGGGGSNETLLNVYQHGNIDQMVWSEGTLTVRDTYSIIGKSKSSGGWEPVIPNDHLENIYINDANLILDHTVLLNPVPQTSTFFANTNNGTDGQPCTNHVTATNNLLAGGGHMMTFCAHASNTGTHTATVTNNRFARCGKGNQTMISGGLWVCPGLTIGASDGEGYYPRGGSFGLTSSYYPPASNWANNVWDENGQVVPEP